MNPERQQFLALRDKPWRVTRQEAAWTLGIQEADIAILMKAKLLKPLGSPAPNGEKYFCYHELTELGKNRAWLDRATKLISQYHRHRNQKPAPDEPLASSAEVQRDLRAQAA